MVLFDCVYMTELTILFGGHEAVTSTVFRPTKFVAGQFLVVSTGWQGLNNIQL